MDSDFQAFPLIGKLLNSLLLASPCISWFGDRGFSHSHINGYALHALLKTGHSIADAENHHAHATSSKTIEHTVSASMLNSCRTNLTVQDSLISLTFTWEENSNLFIEHWCMYMTQVGCFLFQHRLLQWYASMFGSLSSFRHRLHTTFWLANTSGKSFRLFLFELEVVSHWLRFEMRTRLCLFFCTNSIWF
jgi:hypothetical protein